MNYPLLRVVSGALVIVCAFAPSGAAVVTTSNVGLSATQTRINLGPKKGSARRVRIGQQFISASTPSGCSISGSPFFLGIPSGSYDVAGGAATKIGTNSYAGVAAGGYNEACDFYSFIGAGENNTIGGDNGSENAVITGGTGNAIEGATSAFIAAGSSNLISSGATSAIVSGENNYVYGGSSFIGAGEGNSATGNNAFVGSGASNSAEGGDAFVGGGENNSNAGVVDSFIGGGIRNTIEAENSQILGADSFIGGGSGNYVSADSASIVGGGGNGIHGGSADAIGGGGGNSIGYYLAYSTIGGGASNGIGGTGNWATIAGGSANSASGGTAAIGGGYANTASGQYAAIPGGHNNIASGFSAAIGGGATNTVSGEHATVPGGQSNIAAGTNSFAAGTSSDAANSGAFVWSDDATGATVLKSSASNQFLVRASGGFHFYSNATLKSGVYLNAGSGAWSSLSDRNMKTHVVGIDPSAVLAKVSTLPITEWSYSTEDPAVRHVGPMAQDFYAAFGVGEDNRHITTIDEEGVALAAIKALQAEGAAKDRQIAELRDARRADDARLESLEQRLESVERNVRQQRP